MPTRPNWPIVSAIWPRHNAHQAALESARCLYCYDAPCINLPSEIDIPSFIPISAMKTSRARPRKSSRRISSAAAAPAFARRKSFASRPACATTPKECAPVLIGLLQRYAIDNAQFSEHPFKRAPPAANASPWSVPACGLSCAHRLAMHGHDVVIFEARGGRWPQRIRHRRLQAGRRLRPARSGVSPADRRHRNPPRPQTR